MKVIGSLESHCFSAYPTQQVIVRIMKRNFEKEGWKYSELNVCANRRTPLAPKRKIDSHHAFGNFSSLLLISLRNPWYVSKKLHGVLESLHCTTFKDENCERHTCFSSVGGPADRTFQCNFERAHWTSRRLLGKKTTTPSMQRNRWV